METDREPADADLARQAAAGGAEAEARLCRRLIPRIRFIGCRHLRDAAAVDDLIQEVLYATVVALRAGRIRELDDVAGYVRAVALNRIRQHARNEITQRALLAGNPPGPATIEPTVAAVPPGRLEDCLSTLSERERRVVRMSFYDGEPSSAIATALETSPENVRVLRQRSLASLRACLDRNRLVMKR